MGMHGHREGILTEMGTKWSERLDERSRKGEDASQYAAGEESSTPLAARPSVESRQTYTQRRTTNSERSSWEGRNEIGFRGTFERIVLTEGWMECTEHRLGVHGYVSSTVNDDRTCQAAAMARIREGQTHPTNHRNNGQPNANTTNGRTKSGEQQTAANAKSSMVGQLMLNPMTVPGG